MKKLVMIIICALTAAGNNVWGNDFVVMENKEKQLSLSEDISDPYTEDEIYKIVEKTYKRHNYRKLERFFEDWRKNSTANSPEFINQNDTVKAVYDVFAELWENVSEKDSMLFHINNSIRYTIYKGDTMLVASTMFSSEGAEYTGNPIPWVTISNFRPPVLNNSPKSIYSTRNFRNGIESFLRWKGKDEIKYSKDNFDKWYKRHEKIWERWEWVRPYIHPDAISQPYHVIPYPHWREYIIFNETLDKAWVFLESYNGGGGVEFLVIFSKKNGKWEEISREPTGAMWFN